MLKENTILITGGASGVGLELAKRLIEQDNKVLICGRSVEKLKAAQDTLPLYVFQCDLSKQEERVALFEWIRDFHPTCNILVNNAALAHTTNFADDPEAFSKAKLEFETNTLAPIHLTHLLLPLLAKQPKSKIINITTGLVYAPKASYPFYNATKAALHSFTQVLRMQLLKEQTEVIEVLLPAIDTPWHKGKPPKIAISLNQALNETLRKLNKGHKEIRIGGVKILYWIHRIVPQLAYKIINGK